MTNIRAELLAVLKSFALNSPDDGYDWGELYEGDWVFDDLSDPELYALYKHYLNYCKG